MADECYFSRRVFFVPIKASENQHVQTFYYTTETCGIVKKFSRISGLNQLTLLVVHF